MPRKQLDWIPSMPDPTGWRQRHLTAIDLPRGEEVAIVTLLKGWLDYAAIHEDLYESGIGEDGVLGPEWAQIGRALRGLLNGALGRLDGGTLDTIISDTLLAEGFDYD